jgi:hypothetical protein
MVFDIIVGLESRNEPNSIQKVISEVTHNGWIRKGIFGLIRFFQFELIQTQQNKKPFILKN